MRHLRLEPLESRELLSTVAFHWPAESETTEIAARSVDLATVEDSRPWDILGRYGKVESFEEATSPDSFVGPLSLAQLCDDPLYRIGVTADGFLTEHQAGLGLADPFEELEPFSASTDELGMTHLRYHQTVGGVPVFGAEVLVHLDSDGRIAAANGRAVSDIGVDTTPTLSKEEAAAVAVREFKLQFGTIAASGETCGCGSDVSPTAIQVLKTKLYVFNRGIVQNVDDPASHLVWEVQVHRDKPATDESYFVDAHTGDLVYQLTGTRSAIYRKVYDCSYYPRSGGCYLDIGGVMPVYYYGRSEGKPVRGPNPTRYAGFEYFYGTTDVDDLYDLFGEIHDYYWTEFGRDGGNGRGGIGSGSNLTYTRGFTYHDAVGTCAPVAYFEPQAIVCCQGMIFPDLIGHEYAHSVTYYLSFNPDGSRNGLLYEGESGALSENYSDITGEAIEMRVKGTHDWLFAAELDDGPYRNLADPKAVVDDPPNPDRYLDPDFYEGDFDRGGVHVNAGIPNKAFYLATEGGTFNGYEITGVGFEKTQQIWYRAVTEYYTPTETFNGAYYLILQAAEDLYGAEYGEEVVGEVRKALQAVEMHLPRDVELVTVEEVTAESSAISVTFSHNMDVTPMLAAPEGDGSITSAVTILNLTGGPVPTAADQFAYDSATYTLTWTADTALSAGNYELQLRGDLLSTIGGTSLRGGASGLAFSLGEFGPITNIQAGGIDLAVESYSAPTMADLTGDGLLDLIVGEKTASGAGKIRIYANTGTAAAPTFDAHTYAQAASGDVTVTGSGCLGIAPVITDFDGDGVQDIIAGLADGRVRFFANTGTNSAPVFASAVDLTVGPAGSKTPINVGYRAMPTLADFNGDGRDDLLVGALDGKIRVYLDESASGMPDFQTETILQDADGDLVVPSGRAAPAVVDLNDDGRRDLVLGNTEAQLLFYANTGTDAAPQFDGWRLLQADGAVVDLNDTTRSRPWVGDFNADGLDDLLFGTADGLVRLVEAQTPPTVTDGIKEVGEPGGIHLHRFEITPTTIPGDLNTDGYVGSFDLDLVRSHWGNTVPAGSLLDGDPSGDGYVGSADLDLVRAHWGEGVVPAAAGVSNEEPVYGPGQEQSTTHSAKNSNETAARLAWAEAIEALMSKNRATRRIVHPDVVDLVLLGMVE